MVSSHSAGPKLPAPAEGGPPIHPTLTAALKYVASTSPHDRGITYVEAGVKTFAVNIKAASLGVPDGSRRLLSANFTSASAYCLLKFSERLADVRSFATAGSTSGAMKFIVPTISHCAVVPDVDVRSGVVWKLEIVSPAQSITSMGQVT